MSLIATIRRCATCDETYPGGGYRAHALVHTQVRKSATGGPVQENTIRAREMADQGLSQSAIARSLGISRQRVHQILHRDALDRGYRSTATTTYRRAMRGWPTND